MEKVLSSSTLPKTIIMVNSTSFKYSKNALTTMTFETKLPHNIIVQSKVTIKWWIQDTIVVAFHCYVGKKNLFGQSSNVRSSKPTTKVSHANVGL
jgi:hypothetical protein